MNKFLLYQETKCNQDTKTPQEAVFRRRPTNQLNPPRFLGSVHLDEVDESEGRMKHAGIAVAAGATG